VSSGQFKAGAPSRNPTGRPTKFDSAMRQIKKPLEAMGANEHEIWALAMASAERSDVALSIVTTMIRLRLEAERAKPAQESADDDNFF
jgi:hypothetical protein